MEPVITSLLDTDLYKFTMWQTMLHRHPQTQAEYRFVCRNTPAYPLSEIRDEVERQIEHLGPRHPQTCRHCRRKSFGGGAAIAPQDHPPCPPCLRESPPDQRRHPFIQLAPKTAPDVIGFETGQVGHVALLRALPCKDSQTPSRVHPQPAFQNRSPAL